MSLKLTGFVLRTLRKVPVFLKVRVVRFKKRRTSKKYGFFYNSLKALGDNSRRNNRRVLNGIGISTAVYGIVCLDKHSNDNLRSKVSNSFGVISSYLLPMNQVLADDGYQKQRRYEGLQKLNKKKKIVSEKDRPVLILSIDGGGLRGKLTCQLLRELERQLQEKSDHKINNIHEAFDLIVGTSTGGLLAIGLGRLEYSVDKCEQLYDYVAEKAFVQTATSKATFNAANYVNLKYVTQWVGSKYSNSKLREAIKKKTKVSDNEPLFDKETEKKGNNKCRIACVVTGQCDGIEFPMLFRSYRHNGCISTLLPYIPGTCQQTITLLDAAMSTSAAPTYFKPVEKKIQALDESLKIKDVNFVDGGVSANHPHMIAALEAKTLWPNRRIVVISFGTGTSDPTDINQITTVNEGKEEPTQNPVVSAFSAFDTKEFVSLYVMTVLDHLDIVDFVRFNPKIDGDKDKLDGKEHMKYWEDTGVAYAKEYEDYIEACAELLVNAQQFNIMGEIKSS